MINKLDNSEGDPFLTVPPATYYDKAAYQKGVSLPLNHYPRILAAFISIRDRLVIDFPMIKDTKIYVYPINLMKCYGSVSNDDVNPDSLLRNFISIADVLETDVPIAQINGVIWRTLLIKAFTLSGRPWPSGKIINEYLLRRFNLIIGHDCPACGAFLTDDSDICPKCHGSLSYASRQN
ncbi:MAG: hypothetical protein WC947_01345 [Elusimicrobiota bacterium]